MSDNKTFKGECFGVAIQKYEDELETQIQMLFEDDEHWHNHGSPFSSHWLDEIINVLTIAKKHLDIESRNK